jgi:uroporphyrin-III C-methyltransferase
MTDILQSSPKNKAPFLAGEVALVGAGPGDPDLLTLQAFRFIREAEVVVYDRLVSKEIMALLPEQCLQVYVGKKQAHHRVPQDGINELLVEYAKNNKKVLRLKGGDPFIFGRGSEEALFLAEHQINCHIVPGVTAASACTSYAGIPLTHRGVATSCRFITGHLEKDGALDLPWQSLAAEQQTLVFYMGVKSLPVIAEQLAAHGKSPTTPAALIQNGTTANQRIFKGQLTNLNELISEHKIKPPTLIVIGDVVDILNINSITKPGYLDNQLTAAPGLTTTG